MVRVARKRRLEDVVEDADPSDDSHQMKAGLGCRAIIILSMGSSWLHRRGDAAAIFDQRDAL